jgi:hypothetical protein
MSQSQQVQQYPGSSLAAGKHGDNLADILERVLDKGIVIAGDIQIRLLDIELLTIKVRLLIASADKAAEMGITWWRDDPFLSQGDGEGRKELEDRIQRLEKAIEDGGAERE